ncbi:alpha/beta hydrolase family protein [Spirilliplanes yamanashiensis]|uniref:alpha/beta hydrolase family protein n=1 Tax=Spirilliplanes yamanashiensis TaxID=42233 RepID=UPI001EF2961D|nr:prolyl oligopeptidase family serine peptidase [Spirilliplanes yamanashiensis]MDP9818492.1 dipeptidyl aminopeptidase/acylaminoacyl peptidase [Spirilliplanes yamanashiensis]
MASYDAVSLARGAAWWLQSLPGDGGRVALIRADLVSGELAEVTPPGADVGSTIHAYGGGAYAVDGSRVWYVDRSDGRIHLLDVGAGTQVLLDGVAGFGDLTPDRNGLLAVGETADGDCLVHVGPGASSQVLTCTDGFLAAPRPYGDRLAWLRWERDRMPWDATELWAANRRNGELAEPVLVAGGDDESVLEPQWSASHGLTFLSDRSGWWSLYAWDGTDVRPIVTMDADIAAAPWELGYSSYVHLAGGGLAMTVHDGPRQRLLVQQPDGRREQVDLPFSVIKPYLAAAGNHAYCIVSSPTALSRVIEIDLDAGEAWRRLSRPPSKDWASFQPIAPTELRVDGPGGRLNALVYPPHGAAADWAAPTVVRAHPGPTASMTLRPDAQVQFLCSHGFAVVDVDYRGSTGYSRRFRQELYGQWGTADVDDCVATAELMIAEGRTAPGHVFITGASAGGYTALQAVSRSGVFAGAVARSAIIDPARWQQTAPRWQRPHAAALAGPAGPVRAAAVKRPVLLIHGSDDHVAPFSDVAQLADALAAHGKPQELLVLGTAGHELGAKDDTTRALEAELAFYRHRLRALAGG